MSILLEALRKSEKGTTPVEPPTIHTDQAVSVSSEPVGRGPLAVLILFVLLLITWIVWRQYQPPLVIDQPPQNLPAKQGGAIKTPVSTMEAADVASNSTDSTRVASSAGRTPVESYQPEPAATSSSATTRPGSSTSQVTAAVAADPRAGTAPEKEPDGTGTAQAKQPQPISYWELPDAIRADVPEIKFSVLVYAGEPADRFVLVNGQRLAEGDSYGQGITVEEIRREGVVFSYRLYRFLIER